MLLVQNLEFPLFQVFLWGLSLGMLPCFFFSLWLSHTFFTYFQLQCDYDIMFLLNNQRVELLWVSQMYIFCVWGQNLSAAGDFNVTKPEKPPSIWILAKCKRKKNVHAGVRCCCSYLEPFPCGLRSMSSCWNRIQSFKRAAEKRGNDLTRISPRLILLSCKQEWT